LILFLLLCAQVKAGPDPLLDTATDELQRSLAALSQTQEPPYYLGYEIVDRHTLRVQATHGALGSLTDRSLRTADIDVRVGTLALDNTHKIRDGGWFSEADHGRILLPLEGDPRATSVALWRKTDQAWQAAVRRLAHVRGNAAVKVAREDTSADWSLSEPIIDLQPIQDVTLDQQAWAQQLRRVSGTMLKHPHVLDSSAEVTAVAETYRFTSSEGAQLRWSRVTYRVSLWGRTVAEDGMEISLSDYVVAASVEGLPNEAELTASMEALADNLQVLRNAPLMEPYSGPAILKGKAAGVFFHEVLGHRVEGHRQKDEDEGQTFADMVGQPILPAFLSVVDDPTLARLNDVDLSGYYPYDNEGVPAQRVQVVTDGVLQGFLMSRAPIQAIRHSNGHGRRSTGNLVVARQGNLLVLASEIVSAEALREELLEQVKKQGKPFGLIVDDITGGFTLTGRVVPNSFNVRPVAIWRVYADGRPDELVRGGDLIGTPLVTFGRVIRAGGETEVFNGVCGAESGWVPVSASSPSLLISEIEVQRKEKQHDRPPLLPPPALDAP
jgi:predicted Zn-dependent protease